MVGDVLPPVEMQILALVVEQRTGREVAALFERETGRCIPFGSLYTSFRRMRARGFVTSREQPDEDARFKYFMATPRGVAALDRSRAFYFGLGRFGVREDIDTEPGPVESMSACTRERHGHR